MTTLVKQNKSLKSTAFKTGINLVLHTVPLLSKSKFLRHGVLQAGKVAASQISPPNPLSSTLPPGVVTDLSSFGEVFISTFDRVLARQLSDATIRYLAHNLIEGALVNKGERSAKDRFSEQYGMNPPSTLTISPEMACNLHCSGCYANSGPAVQKLDWEILDRVITEAKTLWGVRFLVFSGGEPLVYRSGGKGLLDIAEKHPEIFFMFYTNGTLIDEQTARRMAALGNISPAISVEGFKDRTDERRGEGVFEQILTAMERLRNAGVLFGISLTATRHNHKEILSDKLIDFYFEDQGAFYGWIFQYMPIGRAYTLDLMPTPEQRLWMWRRSWDIVKTRKVFLVDFWNHATLSNGCIAAGRAHGGGYLYIDWNGAVAPCVFMPYSPVNVNDIFSKGGTLNDIWANPFFADIRDWQENYIQRKGNWLAPCLNRDHHDDLTRLIAKHEPQPIDDSARAALLDPEYYQSLKQYGQQYDALTESIWEMQYLQDRR